MSKIGSVELSEAALIRLTELMQETGDPDMRTVLNNALTFYNRAVKEVKKGKTAAFIDDEAQTITEIEMQSFARARALAGIKPRPQPPRRPILKLV
ncbi:MAG: hypothetical protein Q8P82_02420 [bacterium]|nr:hypothetical protein [bacterium]